MPLQQPAPHKAAPALVAGGGGGKPVSKNLPPPHLTSKATIEQRTASVCASLPPADPAPRGVVSPPVTEVKSPLRPPAGVTVNIIQLPAVLAPSVLRRQAPPPLGSVTRKTSSTPSTLVQDTTPPSQRKRSNTTNQPPFASPSSTRPHATIDEPAPQVTTPVDVVSPTVSATALLFAHHQQQHQQLLGKVLFSDGDDDDVDDEAGYASFLQKQPGRRRPKKAPRANASPSVTGGVLPQVSATPQGNRTSAQLLQTPSGAKTGPPKAHRSPSHSHSSGLLSGNGTYLDLLSPRVSTGPTALRPPAALNTSETPLPPKTHGGTKPPLSQQFQLAPVAVAPPLPSADVPTSPMTPQRDDSIPHLAAGDDDEDLARFALQRPKPLWNGFQSGPAAPAEDAWKAVSGSIMLNENNTTAQQQTVSGSSAAFGHRGVYRVTIDAMSSVPSPSAGGLAADGSATESSGTGHHPDFDSVDSHKMRLRRERRQSDARRNVELAAQQARAAHGSFRYGKYAYPGDTEATSTSPPPAATSTTLPGRHASTTDPYSDNGYAYQSDHGDNDNRRNTGSEANGSAESSDVPQPAPSPPPLPAGAVTPAPRPAPAVQIHRRTPRIPDGPSPQEPSPRPTAATPLPTLSFLNLVDSLPGGALPHAARHSSDGGVAGPTVADDDEIVDKAIADAEAAYWYTLQMRRQQRNGGFDTLTMSPRATSPKSPPYGRVRRVGVDSMLRSSVDVTAVQRPWNEAFQVLLERPCTTPLESRIRNDSIRRLCNSFRDAITPIVETIVLERGIHNEDRSVKVQKLGGVAGGEKYLVGNIFLKFCVAPQDRPHLYDDLHTNALKSASAELKGLNALIRSNVPHMHVPLGMCVTFLGQRVWVSGRLPIQSPKTLRYGSEDGGATIHVGDEKSAKMAATAATILNLKLHDVGRPADRIQLPTPADLEIHHGLDGRYYVVDTARLFPPDSNANTEPDEPFYDSKRLPKHAFLYRFLRPERVLENEVPLSSDARSSFTTVFHKGKEIDDKELDQASDTITETAVPMLAHQLGRLFAEEATRRIGPQAAVTVPKSRNTKPDSFAAQAVVAMLGGEPAHALLKKAMHTYGINLRYLGRVLDEFVKWGTATPQPVPLSVVCTTIVAEIVARAFKAVVLTQFNELGPKKAAAASGTSRDTPSDSSGRPTSGERQKDPSFDSAGPLGSPVTSERPTSSGFARRTQPASIEDFHSEGVELYTNLLNGGESARDFWGLAIMPTIMRKFRCSHSTLETIFSCFSRSTINKPWISAHHLHTFIFKRANELLGFNWDVQQDRDGEFFARLGTATSQRRVLSLPMLVSMQPIVKVVDTSPFANVADLLDNEQFSQAERLYLDELEIRQVASPNSNAVVTVLSDLAQLYERWPGREADALEKRRQIVFFYQEQWAETIRNNPHEFADFFSECLPDSLASGGDGEPIMPENVISTLTKEQIFKASSFTVLLPLTPPYIDALNKLGALLLKLHELEEAIDVLSTAAKMASARLAVSAYVNPSRVVAEQILHEQSRLASTLAASVVLPTAIQEQSPDAPQQLANSTATNPPTTSRVNTPVVMEAPAAFEASVTYDLAPVDRAALEGEIEQHSTETRRLLADALTAQGRLQHALTERVATLVAARRLCEHRTAQVVALAGSVVTDFAINASISGSPKFDSTKSGTSSFLRTDQLNLRAILAQVGVADDTIQQAAEHVSAMQRGGETQSAVAVYARALRHLATTFSLLGRTKLACGSSDEALRVMLDPALAISPGSVGAGDRPEQASPLHQRIVCAWLACVMQPVGAAPLEDVMSRQQSSMVYGTSANVSGSVGPVTSPTTSSRALNIVPRTGAAWVEELMFGGVGSLERAATQRERGTQAAVTTILIRAQQVSFLFDGTTSPNVGPEDELYLEGLFDPDACVPLRKPDSSLTALDIAKTVMTCAATRIEDSGFVGDAAAVLVPALAAFKVIIGHYAERTSRRITAHLPTSPVDTLTASSPLVSPSACRYALTMSQLLFRVGAHREGSRLLQKCYAAAKHAYDIACVTGRKRHSSALPLIDSLVARAEAVIIPSIELEAFLPVPASSSAATQALMNANNREPQQQHNSGDHASLSPAVSARGANPSMATPSTPSNATLSNTFSIVEAVESAAVSIARVKEAQQLLLEGLQVVASLGAPAGVHVSRLTTLFAAVKLLHRPSVSLVPVFTAPQRKDNQDIQWTKDSLFVTTRFRKAERGQARFADAVQGFLELQKAATVALMSLNQCGDLSSRYVCLALCVNGLTNIMPLSDSIVLSELMNLEWRSTASKRASLGRQAPVVQEPPPFGEIVLIVGDIYGLTIRAHSTDLRAEDSGNNLTGGSPISRRASPTPSAVAPLNNNNNNNNTSSSSYVAAVTVRAMLSQSMDDFYRALATSDEHMSSDSLDYLSRRCVNHAALLEATAGVKVHSAASKAVPGDRLFDVGATAQGGTSVIPLDRNTQKRRLQSLMLLAAIQLNHGDDATVGIATLRTTLRLFRDTFPIRAQWDPVEEPLLVSLATMSSVLIRKRPFDEIGPDIGRLVERENGKKESYLRHQAEADRRRAEEDAQDAEEQLRQRLAAQLSQVFTYCRYSRPENARSLLIAAAEDFAMLYPEGATSVKPESIATHNEMLAALNAVRIEMNVMQSVLTKLRQEMASLANDVSGTPLNPSSPRDSSDPYERSYGARSWMAFSTPLLSRTAAFGRGSSFSLGSGSAATLAPVAMPSSRTKPVVGGVMYPPAPAPADEITLAAFDMLARQVANALYVLQELPPDFDRHPPHVLDPAKKSLRSLRRFRF